MYSYNYYVKYIIYIFIIFGRINTIFTQSVTPISPCPKMFQYIFNGSEWFGNLSVRNTDIGQPLHLRVVLLLRGKPIANYFGEIELLTRGQFLSHEPLFYKIKFPKNYLNVPPKLLEITRNDQIVCMGAQDHRNFVTKIQLEHTRKFTFMPGPPMHAPSSSLPSFLSPATATMGLAGGPSASTSSIGMENLSALPSNIAVDIKHFPLINMKQNPKRLLKDICGTIDDGIRFQILNKVKQAAAHNVDLLLLSTLLPRQSDKRSARSKNYKVRSTETGSGAIDYKDDVDEEIPPLITIDTETDDDASSADGTTTISKLPSITRGLWPWLAAIYVNNSTSLAYQCGGTLVSSRIVISAAHCFHLFKQRYAANEVLVFLGRHNLTNWNETGSLAAPVDDIFIHPDYKPHLNSYDGDIAVLILKIEVRFNKFIRPACMWIGAQEQMYIEGEHGVVVGWGLGLTKLASTTSIVPRIVSTPIVSNDVCFTANSKFISLSSNRTFCAGKVLSEHEMKKPLKFRGRLHQGPCAGDSGSGLMIFKNNRWILRGTVTGALPMQPSGADSSLPGTARSTQGCNINQYVIYTDVAKFLNWIFAFMI